LKFKLNTAGYLLTGALYFSPYGLYKIWKDTDMRVIFLGKERYQSLPLYERTRQVGINRCHELILLDKKHFLAGDLSNVDIVCLKSHYDDDRVWRKITASGVLAVNNRIATNSCHDRITLDSLLRRSGILVPNSVATPADMSQLTYPVFRKPARASDHDIHLLQANPAAVDAGAYLYQEMVPSNGTVHKTYNVFDRVFLALQNDTGVRVRAEPSPQLIDSVRQIQQATGLVVFGADFIEFENQFYAIDVNPFPGFRDIPECSVALWEYLESVMMVTFD